MGQNRSAMQYLDLTLSTAAENLALDEALLEEAELAATPEETLRIWESPQPMVVVGRSSRVAAEVQVDACKALGIPILRRISGGAAVVAGPGCLMYSLILSYQHRPALRMLSEAHREILNTTAAALSAIVPGVRCHGTSDLTIGGSNADCSTAQTDNPLQMDRTCAADARDRDSLHIPTGHAPILKFSGNSVRCRRGHLLYHGTLLYDFPLALISQCLTMPPRTPDYRAGRDHQSFVVNLPASAEAIRAALRAAWKADRPRSDWPRSETERLVRERYARRDWNES